MTGIATSRPGSEIESRTMVMAAHLPPMTRRSRQRAGACRRGEGTELSRGTELDFIAGELASALGLGGRGRRVGSPIERARKAVASRIRFSVSHVARLHPALADHLRRYIRTGTVCSYVGPDEPVRWSV